MVNMNFIFLNKKINIQYFLKIFIIIQITIFVLDITLGGYFNFVRDFPSILLFFNVVVAFVLTRKNLKLKTYSNIIYILLSGLAIIYLVWYLFSGVQYYQIAKQSRVYSLSGKLAFHDKYAYDYNIYGYGKLRKSKLYSRIVNGISFTDLVINDSDRFSLVCGLHQYIHCWHFFKLSDYSDYDVKVKFYTLKKESGDYYNIVLSIEGVNGNLNLLNSYRKFFIIDLIVCYIFLVLYVLYFLLLIRRLKK